jgi:hypothetical protein
VVQPRGTGIPYRPFEPTVAMEQTLRGTGDVVSVDNGANPGPPTLAVAFSGTASPAAVPDRSSTWVAPTWRVGS